MILVIGANGRVGRVVAKLLINAGVRPRLLVRDDGSARERFSEDVDIQLGDLADTDSVKMAMSGVDAVFLCSPVHPDQVRLQGNVVDAASREGAYVVKLSGLATFPGSFVNSGRWHAETEDMIRTASLRHAFLHPYFFTQNLGFQLSSAREKGYITSAIPDVPIAMVDANDVAAVAARLLVDPTLAPNETFPLTAEAASHREIASKFGKLLGREVECVPIDMDKLESNLRASGQPDWHVRILLQFNRAFGDGLGSKPDPSIERLLGRPPVSIEASLKALLDDSAEDSNPFPNG